MKHAFLTITLLLGSSMAFANSLTATCENASGNKTVTLFINEDKITRVGVQTQGSLAKMFSAKEFKMGTKTSIYTLNGSSGTLEVDNNVLIGGGGRLTMLNERFNCL